jgi:hypothetical protein
MELRRMQQQLAPILDRTGRLMCDMAHVVKPRTGDVLLMPTQREIAALNPRGLGGTEVHIYNI